MPDPGKFAYTFERLAEVTQHFLTEKGFHRYGMFVSRTMGDRSVSGLPGDIQRFWSG
jgi:hypothetical protein